MVDTPEVPKPENDGVEAEDIKALLGRHTDDGPGGLVFGGSVRGLPAGDYEGDDE